MAKKKEIKIEEVEQTLETTLDATQLITDELNNMLKEESNFENTNAVNEDELVTTKSYVNHLIEETQEAYKAIESLRQELRILKEECGQNKRVKEIIYNNELHEGWDGSDPLHSINDIVMYPSKYQRMKFKVTHNSGVSSTGKILYRICNFETGIIETSVEENKLLADDTGGFKQ